MAQLFHTLTVKKIIRETADCVSLTFDIPSSLKNEFEFKEGQNIVIKHFHQGEEIRRSYSICNAPHEQELKVAVKKIQGGLFSSFANDQLKANETLEIMPPSGKFNAHLCTESFPNYLAIAAGSGITPVISIIKHTLHSQPNSRFTLLYGNQNRSSVIFFEELEGLKNQYIDRLTIINILSREKTDSEILHGRIDTQKLSSLNKIIDYSQTTAAYLCGPETMIFEAAAFLEQNGMDKSKIHFELFTSSASIKKAEAVIAMQNDDGPKSKITIRLDGRTFDFDLSFNGEPILDAALKQGADLPYACKGGVCCTCRAKLLEGTVKMDVNYALEQEELEQGFILTCQSHPASSKVVVDFDEK